MSAKTLLIAHGEKAAVVIVLGACAFILSGTSGDETLRPKITSANIEEMNTRIGDTLNRQSPPVMKEPRPYLDELKARVAQPVPAVAAAAWMTAPHDIGIIDNEAAYIYVYEVSAPTVTLTDNIGTLTLSVALPTDMPASEAEGRRIGSALNRTWTRTYRGRIINRAQVAGVQVEMRVGDSDWKPLVVAGASADGVLPLSAIQGPLTITAPEAWQRHEVRARLVVTATGLTLGKAPAKGTRATVVVTHGKTVATPQEDERFIQGLARELEDSKIPARLVAPVPAPAGVRPASDEHCYTGPDSAVAGVQATASVRFAFLGTRSEPLKDDPTKSREVARFALLRFFEMPDGTRKWMEKPVDMQHGLGEAVGAKVIGIPPGQKDRREIDLSTPFVVEKILKDQKRILSWSVREKGRQGGGRGKELTIDKVEKPTEIVVLRNPVTGREMVLTKLMPVPPPKPNTWVYPFRRSAVNETEQFTKDPAGFRQWGLAPEEPKLFQPGTGPLADLARADAKNADIYSTDTPYAVFADGRLLYWEPLNGRTRLLDPNEVEKSTEPAQAADPAAADAPQAPPAPSTDK